jgi:SPP1 family predicted phage head-tail adaptor
VALADRLRHEFTIQRFEVVLDVDDEPVEDDYGQVQRTWPTLATVAGWMQPLTAREMDQIAGGGPVVTTHRGYVLPTDVRAADRIELAGQVYAIDSVIDPAAKGHHLELLCHLVTV